MISWPLRSKTLCLAFGRMAEFTALDFQIACHRVSGHVLGQSLLIAVSNYLNKPTTGRKG